MPPTRRPLSALAVCLWPLAAAVLLSDMTAGCDSTRPAAGGLAGGQGRAGGAAGPAGGAGAGGAASSAGGAGGAPGASEGDSPDFHAGTRLTFPFYRTADGVMQPRGDIYDTGRREACQITRASDGQKRCMPDPQTYASDLFADPACTQRLGEGSAEDGPPYVKFFLPTTACEGTSLVELRERLPALPSGGSGYAKSGTACVPAGLSVRSVYFPTGSIVPPDAFVAVEDVIVPAPATGGGGAAARLDEVHRRGADGSWVRTAFYDRVLQTRCEPRVTSDGQTRCAPRVRPDTTAGALDCDGQGRTGTSGACAGAPAALVSRWVPAPPPACASAVSVFEACLLAGALTLGSETPPAELAPLPLERTDSSRLRPAHYADGTGGPARLLPVSMPFYDAALDERCGFVEGTDGKARCTPPTLLTAYHDPGCATSPVGVDLAADPCLTEPTERFIAVGSEIYARGPLLTARPTVLYIPSTPAGSGCYRADFLVGDQIRYYAPGAAITVGLATGSVVAP